MQLWKLLLFLLIIFAAGTGWFFYQSGNTLFQSASTNENYPQPTAIPQITEEEATSSPTAITDEQINFTRTGNLVLTDSKKEVGLDNFSLLYEKPGAAALKVGLVFVEYSQCQEGSGFLSCREAELTVGDRVSIRGISQGNKVSVVEVSRVSQ